MNPVYSQTALICPYTLIEEEALAWSILLFNQVILLQPFPLPVPASFQPLFDQGRLQVRSPARSQDEIRIKDKSLREIQAFISSKPDQGFLKYLKEASLLEDRETQEELVGLLKGQPSMESSQDTGIFKGHILLCLIHEWIIQEMVMDAALVKIEEQEKSLVQGWQEDLGEGSSRSDRASRVISRSETEIPCLLALKAWTELKNQLAPEPFCLFTSQPWVWKTHYGTDWEEGHSISMALPDFSASISDSFRGLTNDGFAKNKIPSIQEAWKGLLSASFLGEPEGLINDFKKTISGLNLPDQGRYKLILPLFQPSQENQTSLLGLGNVNPLILITS